MKLTEGEDYYLLPDGRLVFTAAFLQRRGWCCGNGCLNCPYDYEAVAASKRSRLLAERAQNEKEHGSEAQ